MDNVINRLNKMNFYVRRAMDDLMPVNWVLPERVIFDYEILYIMEGGAIITAGDTEYEAAPGDIFFFRPNKKNGIRACGNTRLRQPHIHFDFFLEDNSEEVYIPVPYIKDPINDFSLSREDITSEGFFCIPDKIKLPFPEIAENIIFRIITEQNSLSPLAILRKKALMSELMTLLLENSLPPMIKTSQSMSPSAVSRINEVIEASYMFALDVDRLASEAGYSKNHFVKVYKMISGITPSAYHEKCRLEKSQLYLAQREISITEISNILGFDTIHNFSRFFKRHTGLSPSDFRREFQKKSDPTDIAATDFSPEK